MGRPSSSGAPAFRFTQSEVVEMERILQEHHNAMPSREIVLALVDVFSKSPDRIGKIQVHMKQVWNWFQNRLNAIKGKSPMPRGDADPMITIPQPIAAPMQPPMPAPVSARKVTITQFEAKSARDGAWYDIAEFLAQRNLETGNMEVQVRLAGFGPEEDEWVNVVSHVRRRSLPCEASECIVVVPGDLILCFQERKDQSLYYDAHVLDVRRRKHDVRGCRCMFLIRYDHDQSEEVVPLRKLCRRPETDYRLHQLKGMKDSVSMDQHKTSLDCPTADASRVIPAASISQAHVPVASRETHTAEPINAASVGIGNCK